VKVALALQPENETFGLIPLMIILVEDLECASWLEAKQFVFDLEDVAPQVVWVDAEQQGEFEGKLAGKGIGRCSDRAAHRRLRVPRGGFAELGD
jgi:hypothetical protein